MPYEIVPLEVSPGVQPATDFTEQSTTHYTFSDKVRYVDGYPEKIGGWDTLTIEGGDAILGCPRNIYSYTLNNKQNYLVGTHSNLYHIIGNQLSNMTPVVTATAALNDDFSSYYGTLANNPLTTVNGTPVLVISDAGHRFKGGEIISLSGATAVGGVPATEINANHVVSSVTTNTYSIGVSTIATLDAVGGGASVVRASRLITVSQPAHGFQDGDNVVIASAAASVGGIPDTSINGLHRIQNVTDDEYDFRTISIATSSATATGGAATVQGEINDGVCDPTTGQGYGLGLYGVGLYGVAKIAASPVAPSIWSFDRFGNLVILTRGTQTGLYSWDSVVTTLPTLIPNAPASVNYAFVSNEIPVTLGADGVPNRIQWGDQGTLTVWGATAENQAGQDDIEGAGKFISHAALRGFNLLFTANAVYSFRYIGQPFVWETKLIDPARGLIAQNARVVVNGIAYWMGADNFYQYRGGNVEIIPSNTTTETTLKDYVFDNLNEVQVSKSFAWYNEDFNEIWWHYPSGGSVEPDSVAVFNIRTREWSPHTINRTAAESPIKSSTFPYLADIEGVVYRHENGSDADDSPLSWTLRSPYFNTGTLPVALGGLIVDSIRNGDITVKLNTKFYPKGEVSSTSYVIDEAVDKIVYRRRGRYLQYEVTGNSLGQSWRGGQWQQLVKPSGRK